MTKRHIRVVAAQVERDGRYMITQRKPSSSLPLLWEFPGGRVEPGEDDHQALAREIEEGLGVAIKVKEPSVSVVHEYEAYVIDFRVYRCDLLDPPEAVQRLGVNDVRWVAPTELDDYEFPGADQASVDALLGEG